MHLGLLPSTLSTFRLSRERNGLQQMRTRTLNERKNMSDQFDEVSKSLAQSVTRHKSPLKPNTQSAFPGTPNRRAFLRGLGAVGVGSLFCSRPEIAASARYAQRFQ